MALVSPTAVRAAFTGPRQKSIILALVCVAQFMVVLDISIVNVALPDMQNDLHMSTTALQWVINAYTLTFAGFLLLGGRAADVWGRRRLFLGGLLLFAAMSLLGGFAQSGGELIGARALQGLGCAVLSPATLTILTVTFVEPKERVRALGAWSAMAAAGGATGTLAGGILTDLLSWRWILFVNVPIAVAAAVVAWFSVPESHGEGERPRLDWAGAVLVTGGLTVLVYGIVSTDTRAWGSAATLGTLAAGVVLLGAFVAVEQRHPHPLVPLHLFGVRAVTGANLYMIVQGTAMFSVFYFLSLYEQDVHGYSPLRTGFAFVPMPLAIMAGTRLAARLMARVGARNLLLVAPAVAGGGLAWLGFLGPDSGYLFGVGIPCAILAFGIGLSFVPVTLSATTGVSPADAGLASGLINTTRQIGGSVGLAALVTVAASRQHGAGSLLAAVAGGQHASLQGTVLDRAVTDTTSGYGLAFWVAAALYVLAFAVAVLIMPRSPRPQQTPLTEAAEEGLPALETA